MAKRSSVVRLLLGDRKTLSSSVFDSSVRGDIVGSLGVDSETKFHKMSHAKPKLQTVKKILITHTISLK